MKKHFPLILLAIATFTHIATKAESTHPGTLERHISGTLPVVYINTVDSTVIDQKETYIDATYWIDPMGIEGIDSLGSPENPMTMLIRGRGNSSWEYPKKPYKVKLPKKQSILGMPAHKHWALMAQFPQQGFIHESLCFELARRIDIGWVPRQEFCEVVLNGRCIGLYGFSEVVKTGKDRLNIYEQEDENTDESVLHGGWLIEIDNTEDTQILVTQPGNPEQQPYDARFTYKMPEVLSDLQHEWLVNEFTAMTEAIYAEDKSSTEWENYIDITRAARYYIIQESTGNLDAYCGSTYLYKDLEGKWMFGPIWDSGWTFTSFDRIGPLWDERERAEGTDPYFVWIEELMKFPRFRQAVVDEWNNFYNVKDLGTDEFVDSLYTKIEDAWNINYDTIWADYGPYIFKLPEVAYWCKYLHNNYNEWMDSYVKNMSEELSVIAGIDGVEADSEKPVVVSATDDGLVRVEASKDVRSVQVYNVFGQRVSSTDKGDGCYKIDAPMGLYVVGVTLDDGSRHASKVRF